MNQIVAAILSGEGPDPSMPKEELEFWRDSASSIAARPPGLIMDFVNDNAVDTEGALMLAEEMKRGKKEPAK